MSLVCLTFLLRDALPTVISLCSFFLKRDLRRTAPEKAKSACLHVMFCVTIQHKSFAWQYKQEFKL